MPLAPGIRESGPELAIKVISEKGGEMISIQFPKKE